MDDDKSVKSKPKFPIFELQPDGSRKFVVRNLFKFRASWQIVVLIIFVAATMLSYRSDIAKCNDFFENPRPYCVASKACFPNETDTKYTTDIGKMDIGALEVEVDEEFKVSFFNVSD